MDTPDKNQITATSVSKFEDSPVFNYINNLSPIEPFKSIQAGCTFSSPTFTSPGSVFTSPQISSHRESRFLIRRHYLSDSAAPRRDENNKSEAVAEGVKFSDPCVEQLGCLTPGNSAREINIEPPNEHLELAIELPKTMKYDCGSPDNNMVSCNAIKADTMPEIGGSLSLEHLPEFDKDDFKGRRLSFESKTDLRKICQIEQNEEAAGYDWVTLISDVADLLNYNSFIIETNSEEQDQKIEDPGTISFVSTVLQLPPDNTNDFENMGSAGPSGSCQQSDMGEPVTYSKEIGDMKETDQTPAILSNTLLDKLVVSDSSAKIDAKEERCSQSSCKVLPGLQQQHSIRRRCLVFEMAGAHKNQSVCDSNCSSSISLQSDSKVAYIGKHLALNNAGSSHSSSILPGVGLHLNTLVTTNVGKVIKCDTLASGRQLISMPSSMSSFDSLTSGQKPLNKSLVPCDDESKIMESAPQISTTVGDEEFDHNSPKRKRLRSNHVSESEACKRCNCKRSKCLKLYCECFAAGLYCVEPCSCQDCFNKPSHEDTVLDTRRQIESRNPLAFAPKVIRSIDCIPEYGDETNKTPASARHKRGCNCKKSSCLKKYCECFQGGVGCSIGCRCEGCKNSFGRKDGAEETEIVEEDLEASEKNAIDLSSLNVAKEGEQEHPDLPITPSEIASPQTHRSFTFSGKLLGSSLLAVGPSPKPCTSQKLGTSDFFCRQPKFKMHLQVIPEDETPEILKRNCSPTSGAKSAAANSKRISPPNCKFGSSTAWQSSRKLILRSVPPFPSLTPPREQ